MGIVKCPCYFLSTFDDVTPSRSVRIVIADHNIIIFIRVLCNQLSFFCVPYTSLVMRFVPYRNLYQVLREKPSLFRQKQLGDAFGGISSKYIIQFLIVMALNYMYQSLICESANLYELLFLKSTDFKILYKASYAVI